MKLHIDRRGRGKTAALIEWMREAPDGEVRVYIGHDHEAAMTAYRSTMTENDDGLMVSDLASWQFGSWDELATVDDIARRFGPSAPAVVFGPSRVVLGIDNLDLILRRIVGHRIGIATWNADEIIERLSGEIIIETPS